MKIEFYIKETDKVLANSITQGYFFVMDNEVWADNGYACESQSAYVDFNDFIKLRPETRAARLSAGQARHMGEWNHAAAITGPSSKNKSFNDFAAKAKALKSKGQSECKK